MIWVVKVGGLYLDARNLDSTLTAKQRRATRYSVRDAACAAAYTYNASEAILYRMRYMLNKGHTARVVRVRER